MSQLIEVSIDVTKIDKKRLVVGKNGTYLNLIVSVNDDTDRFGQDVAAYEKQTDGERTAKANKNYLGNGKTFWADGHNKTAKDKTDPAGVDTKAPEVPNFGDDDDLPF